MTSTPSLRDLYSPHSMPWSFVPPPSKSGPSAPPPGPSYQWSTPSRPNPTFDLTSLNAGEPSSLNFRPLWRSLVTSVLLRYSSTALAMPFEVGELLLQVQWVPRDAAVTQLEPEEEAEEDQSLSDASNDESYFVDPGAGPSIKYPPPKLVDDSGYVMRTSVMEEGTRPEYVIPVGSVEGTWAMAKRLISFRGEGWLSPWKGLLTACIHDALLATMQPIVEGCLTWCFLWSPQGFYRPPLWLPVVSRIITGLALSPLDLVRTRLIAQSSMPRHKTYSGPIHALSEILSQEGGLRGVYFHPHLFIPTILDTGLRSFAQLVLPSLIAPRLGFGPHVAADTHPIAWSFAEVVGECLGLLIIVPIQTVRRRLQVQTRGTAKSLRTCVESRPVPYNGVVDALWHILTEERSDLPIKRRKRSKKATQKEKQGAEDTEADDESESWLKHTGIGQLYRGLGMHIAAAAVVVVLTALGGRQEIDSDWVEL